MDPNEPNERDSTPLRIAKFIAIIGVLAAIFGVMGAGVYYLMQYSTAKRSHRVTSTQNVQRNDPMPALKGWFFAGAAIGASIGVFYTARCLIRGEDP